MLKISNFPVKGSSEQQFSKTDVAKLENIKNQVANEIKNIQTEMKNNQADKLETNELSSMRILGELLVQLRKNRSMSLLMLARQITKIEFEGKTAVIYSDDKDIVELSKNEKYFAEVSQFFESKGLSFRVQEKVEDNSKLEELKRLLGRKLVIK